MLTGGGGGIDESLPGTMLDDLKAIGMPYGVYVNPYTGYIYATDAGSFAAAGALMQWSPEGVFLGSHKVYINPAHFLALPPDGADFTGIGKSFDLPLNPRGTVFQQQVWKALYDIPYGETRSYKQIAESIGNPKAVRAVGMANNRNPILIVVPCHRVIGANGKLVGYGAGIEKKEFLLKLEKSLL